MADLQTAMPPKMVRHFIRTHFERAIPQPGPSIPATTLMCFWILLAHTQGGPLNALKLASSLGGHHLPMSGPDG